MSYHIEDWSSNRELFDGQRFDTFEDAREYISELSTIEADNNFKRDTQDWEDLYNSVCEDLYAIEDTRQ